MASPATTHLDVLCGILANALRSWGAETLRSGAAALRVLSSPRVALPLSYVRDLATWAGILDGPNNSMTRLNTILSAARGERDHVELAPVICEAMVPLFTKTGPVATTRSTTLAVVTAMFVVAIDDDRTQHTPAAADSLARGESGPCHASSITPGGEYITKALMQVVSPVDVMRWSSAWFGETSVMLFVARWCTFHIPGEPGPCAIAPPAPFLGFCAPASLCACNSECTRSDFVARTPTALPLGPHAAELRFALEVSIYAKSMHSLMGGHAMSPAYVDIVATLERIRTGLFHDWAWMYEKDSQSAPATPVKQMHN